MNRLTFDGCFCDIAQCMEPNPCKHDGMCSQRQTWERLKTYEDTGLEPEEILAELDRVKAERDGRLVVLPCKIGDTVYMPVGKWNTITGYEEGKCDGFYIGKDGILQIKTKCDTRKHGGTYGVPGKTAFLTREEVEKALEGDR